MTISSGVEVSAWLKIGDDATIDYHAYAEDVEFYVGGRHGFVLVTSEEGLRNLVGQAQEALREVQSAAAGDDECYPPA